MLADPYPSKSSRNPARRVLHRLVPLRPRLRAMAVLRLGQNLVRRGPVATWEIYRLSTRQGVARSPRERPVLQPQRSSSQCCATLFPATSWSSLTVPSSG